MCTDSKTSSTKQCSLQFKRILRSIPRYTERRVVIGVYQHVYSNMMYISVLDLLMIVHRTVKTLEIFNSIYLTYHGWTSLL